MMEPFVVLNRFDGCRYVNDHIDICQYVDMTAAPFSPSDPCCVLDGPLSESDADRIATMLKALADPIRVRLVSLLAAAPTGEVCACDLPQALGKSQPTISHHLTQLVSVGLVHREQRGKWAWFSLQRDVLATVRTVLGEGRLTGEAATVPAVLFLCVHNAGRSQMAAGFMRHIAGGQINVISAGSAPGTALNPVAVQAMKEVGIDITSASPQKWTTDMLRQTDVIVSMGCGDECPIYPGTRRIEWALNDPAGQDIDFVRDVRDQIEQHVRTLINELTPGCC
jgi:arsenate reductase (thioredoxin)